ncbi:DMT family transporter [Allosaccharopolyspora coralli]|uniref:DMT family transporter n=1 Tax=Allosaccharopolyspora coralli TaxID=2665642 RepID=UPI0016529BDB|nr:DMT family transporter [Allosaccharopolyspora coralli]
MTSPADTTQQKTPVRRTLGLVGAAGCGLILAIQSRINGTLGTRLGDGLAAAVVSFSAGLIVLIVLSLAMPSARAGMRRLVTEVREPGGGLRPWHCLGGVCGGFLVFTQSSTVGMLGVALFTVGVVAGQVTSGLVVDRFGLGPGGPRTVTVTRFAGAGLAIVSVVIAVSAELDGGRASWLVLLPALAGVGIAWQQAVNGRVRYTAGSTVSATTVNFAVGTAALVLAFGAHLATGATPNPLPGEWWLYVGGPIGIFVIGGAVVFVRYTGVLLLSMAMIAGQLSGALLLDLLLPAPGTVVHTSTLVGIGLTFLAVVVAVLPEPTRTGTGTSAGSLRG